MLVCWEHISSSQSARPLQHLPFQKASLSPVPTELTLQLLSTSCLLGGPTWGLVPRLLPPLLLGKGHCPVEGHQGLQSKAGFLLAHSGPSAVLDSVAPLWGCGLRGWAGGQRWLPACTAGFFCSWPHHFWPLPDSDPSEVSAMLPGLNSRRISGFFLNHYGPYTLSGPWICLLQVSSNYQLMVSPLSNSGDTHRTRHSQRPLSSSRLSWLHLAYFYHFSLSFETGSHAA